MGQGRINRVIKGHWTSVSSPRAVETVTPPEAFLDDSAGAQPGSGHQSSVLQTQLFSFPEHSIIFGGQMM